MDGWSRTLPRYHPSALLDALGARGPTPLNLLESFFGYIRRCGSEAEGPLAEAKVRARTKIES